MKGLKDWSLGARLTFWSALTVTGAILLCGVVAGVYIHSEQIESLDEQLQNEAHIAFGEFNRQSDSLDWTAEDQIKQALPLTLTERFVEVDRGSNFLYRSKNLGDRRLAGAPDGLSSIEIADTPARLGVFHEDGLTLHIAASLDEIDGDTNALIFGFLAGLPFLLAAVALGGRWLARKALAPIRGIIDAAEQLTADRLDRRLPVPPVRDEIGRLSVVLNAMFDRLDISFKQAMRFSADASHELKTPLTLLRSSIEDLLESPTLTEPDRVAIDMLLEHTRRLASIIEGLLLLSRADAGRLKLDFKPTNVASVIRACADDTAILSEMREITIETQVPDELPGYVDAARLTQILLNLLDNSIKYNYDRGKVWMSAENLKDELVIMVENTGPKISTSAAPQLFDRFFRMESQPDTPGYGLGLSLARELARAHRGDVVLVKSDDESTIFSVRIAAAAPVAVATTPSA